MFYPARLALARKRRGMTKTALAEATGLSLRILNAYEQGDKNPSDGALKILAGVLHFPVDFFSVREVEAPHPDQASFRALRSLKASERDAALAAGVLAVELGKWIERRFELPEPNVPSLRGYAPEEAADALRAEWGLGQRPINNMVHLLEAHGVRVLSLPGDSSSVDAFSLRDGETPFVFLTTQKSGERGRMDAAHELGHLTLHQHVPPAGREAELEADRFASAFLMPRGSVIANAPRTPTLPALIRLKENWMVSVASLVHRLHSLQLVSDWHYRTLCIELSTLGFRKNEPNGIPRETSQVLNKVFATLRAEGIPRGVIARELNIDPDELEALIFGLVISSVPGGRATKSGQSISRASLKIVKE
jgi:Zn-dependent peptidase ImmA (M78 family)/DNA-binding XRE family transcriptional regulator